MTAAQTKVLVVKVGGSGLRADLVGIAAGSDRHMKEQNQGWFQGFHFHQLAGWVATTEIRSLWVKQPS